ncbi:MAG: beta-lactamase family protein [Pseudomonadales bacterium]|nr:beta-lactamase family protein [Pseudomonadales bacterium]
MSKDFPIQGYVKPGLEHVRNVFHENFIHGIDVGASLCVYHNDQLLIDLWGGYRDRNCSAPWTEDTLVNVYSTTKGLASIVVALAVEAGCLDYNEPVSKYWPELTAAKDGLTVGQLLSHQGGLCGVEQKLVVDDLYDWKRMVSLLEAQAPLWKPGTSSGYHAITWGYLAGELVKRTLGVKLMHESDFDRPLTLGQIFAQKIASPLRADAYIGLPRAELQRVAEMIGPNHARNQPVDPGSATVPDALYKLSLMNPVIGPYRDVSGDAWPCAEIPAANGQATAKGVSKIYSGLANGGIFQNTSVITPETIEQATVEEWGMDKDRVLGRSVRRGRGFMLNTESRFGPNNSSFGHTGAGGSLGFADPAQKIGFAYLMNQMQPESDTPTRSDLLIEALYSSL